MFACLPKSVWSLLFTSILNIQITTSTSVNDQVLLPSTISSIVFRLDQYQICAFFSLFMHYLILRNAMVLGKWFFSICKILAQRILLVRQEVSERLLAEYLRQVLNTNFLNFARKISIYNVI